MSKADVLFKNMCADILNNGTTTEGQKVRPKWEDGNPAYTIKRFGYVNDYDLREEFPAITYRKTAIKSATDEILWIFQKKSNDVKKLNSHIWDQWADENGSIGKAYGYQIGLEYAHHKTYSHDYKIWDDLKAYPSATIENSFSDTPIVNLDQMDAVLYDLKHNPFSRRIMTNIYNFKDLMEMNLQPCCWSCTFNVTDEGYDKLILNMVLNQRSSDVLVANNWNVCQYAILLMMVAQVSDMIPGRLLHVMADAHIYDRHVDMVKELIHREMHDAPKVTLNPDIKNFYEFKVDDVIVENYITGEQIHNIPVAV